MLSKKFYIGIGVLAICAIGFLSLRSDVPDEPITIYKAVPVVKRLYTPTAKALVGDTSRDGHFHADGTFHETPHVETDQKGNDHKSDDAYQPSMDAVPTGKSELVKDLEAQIKELEESIDSHKEMAEIHAWFETNLEPLCTELRPLFAELSTGDLGAAEAFFEANYPTTEAKLDAAHKMLELTDLCREFLSLIDNSSELSRSRYYDILESGNGWLLGLQNPAYIPTLKQFIAYYGGEE